MEDEGGIVLNQRCVVSSQSSHMGTHRQPEKVVHSSAFLRLDGECKYRK